MEIKDKDLWEIADEYIKKESMFPNPNDSRWVSFIAGAKYILEKLKGQNAEGQDVEKV